MERENGSVTMTEMSTLKSPLLKQDLCLMCPAVFLSSSSSTMFQPQNKSGIKTSKWKRDWIYATKWPKLRLSHELFQEYKRLVIRF